VKPKQLASSIGLRQHSHWLKRTTGCTLVLRPFACDSDAPLRSGGDLRSSQLQQLQSELEGLTDRRSSSEQSTVIMQCGRRKKRCMNSTGVPSPPTV
jgi:hypothetical protein